MSEKPRSGATSRARSAEMVARRDVGKGARFHVMVGGGGGGGWLDWCLQRCAAGGRTSVLREGRGDEDKRKETGSFHVSSSFPSTVVHFTVYRNGGEDVHYSSRTPSHGAIAVQLGEGQHRHLRGYGAADTR